PVYGVEPRAVLIPRLWGRARKIVVPGAGLEPARCYQRGILNPYEQYNRNVALTSIVPNRLTHLSA
ncbi:hypothetical protein, partial [Alteromonas australica]